MDATDFPEVEINGKKMHLPVTEGSLYRSAYHGTSRDRAQIIDRNQQMEPGEDGHYGGGLYFWLANLRVAIWWSKDRCGHGGQYGVVTAIVDCRRTLHAEQVWQDKELQRAAKETWGEDAVPDDFSSSHWKTKSVGILATICEKFGIEIDSIHFTRNRIGPFNHPVSGLVLYDPDRVRGLRVVPLEKIPPGWEDFEYE
jgi:hypothetical protein